MQRSGTAKFLALSIAFLCLISATHAHDIGSSDATFYVRPTGIDCELRMGLNSGAMLLAEPGNALSITPATFSQYAVNLQAVATSLFELSVEDGSELSPDSVAVSLNEQSDICYNLHFPAPAQLPAKLKIRAAYLQQMVETHLASIYVFDQTGRRLGWGEARPDSDVVTAQLPAAQLSASQPAIQTPTPVTLQPIKESGWLLWCVLFACVGAMAVVFSLSVVRKKRATDPPIAGSNEEYGA